MDIGSAVVPARRMSEVAKIAVGGGPHGHIAYSTVLDQVWVAGGGTSTVSVLGGSSLEVESTVDVGGAPRHVVVDDEGGRAFVAVDDALVVVDMRTGRVGRRIAPAHGGRATCLLPMLPRRLYVLGDAGHTTIVDAAREVVAGSIPTGRGSSWGQPHERSCGKLYVSNATTNDVTVVDEATETPIADLPVGRAPRRCAIFRERGLVYTANADDGTVSAISIAEDAVVATVPAGSAPFRLIGMEKKTGRPELWVLDRGSASAVGAIAVISALEHRPIGRIGLMERPCNWLFAGPLAHVVGSDRELLIIDSQMSAAVGSAVLSEEPDPDSFSNMVFDRRQRLFIANASDSVSVFAVVG